MGKTNRRTRRICRSKAPENESDGDKEAIVKS